MIERPLGPDAGLAFAETEEADEEEALEEAPADPLGQMELAARIMVTGGEDDPLHRIFRGARLILRKSILKAAEDVRRAGRIQVLTQDVAAALRTLPDLEAHRRHEAEEMAEGLEFFCTGIQSRFFHREGRPPGTQADITILQLGAPRSRGLRGLARLRLHLDREPHPGPRGTASTGWPGHDRGQRRGASHHHPSAARTLHG